MKLDLKTTFYIPSCWYVLLMLWLHNMYNMQTQVLNKVMYCLLQTLCLHDIVAGSCCGYRVLLDQLIAWQVHMLWLESKVTIRYHYPLLSFDTTEQALSRMRSSSVCLR